jgi:D-beta-D-heptose 7-phosphate kinase/D-beta-D-heptose 1-phosphate adenosyltransferase
MELTNELTNMVKNGHVDFSDIRIAVIGDCMLDIYCYGDVDRISPEAPIPIFKIGNEEPEHRLGGACNTAMNLAKLGVKTSLFGFVGKDLGATYIKTYLLEYAAVDYHLFDLSNFPTITKNRYFSKGQQIIRIDQECIDGLVYNRTTQKKLIQSFMGTFDIFKRFDAIIFSDYGKGALNHPVLPSIKKACMEKQIPIFVDPKLTNWEPYRGAFCITPNWYEFKGVCHTPGLKFDETDEITKWGQILCEKYDLEYILITKGNKGMTLINKNGQANNVKAEKSEIYDVSGAGDTVVAVFTAAHAKKYSLITAMQLATMAAKVVIGKLGTYAITNSELNIELLNSTFGKENCNNV